MSNPALLEELVGELLRARGWRLAVAESCTGGLIGHRLTNIAGSSTYYMGSITAYAYEAKVRLLGVTWETLEQHGAVSEPVVLQMARGVRQALAADVGLSVSGIAGPTGGTPEKPVGLTCFGLSTPHHEQAWHFTWQGDRLHNKEQSAEQGLKLLVDYLGRKMEAIKVKARFDSQGNVFPIQFEWHGQLYRVDSIGRRWQGADGLHILVLVTGGRAFHLCFDANQDTWHVIRGGDIPTVPVA